MAKTIVFKSNKTSLLFGWIFVIAGISAELLLIIQLNRNYNPQDQILKASVLYLVGSLPLLISKLGHSMLIKQLTIKKNEYVIMKRWFGNIKIPLKEIKEWYIGEFSSDSTSQFYLVLKTSKKEYAYPLSGTGASIGQAWQTFNDYLPEAKLKDNEKKTQPYPNLLELTL